MILSPSLFLVINEISFIIGKVTSDSSADLVFMRVTYGSTSIMWSNSISCPSTGCYDESTEGVLSEDNSKFYSIRVYGVNPYYALFNSFNASDGTVIGNRYVSNVNCNYATIALNDALLVIALVCNSIPTIALYDFADDNFSFYYELTSRTGFFYYIITNPMNDAVMIAGQDSNSYGYIFTGYVEGFSVNSDFQSSTLEMSILQSGSYDVNTLSTQSISGLTAYTVSSLSTTTYSEQLVSRDHYTKSKSDVYYINNDVKYLNLIENTYKELSLDISCSILGSTSITYSIGTYNSKGELAPNWVSVSSLGILQVTAPKVSSNTTYMFYVEAKVLNADLNIELEVTLQINKCTISNCYTCSSDI